MNVASPSILISLWRSWTPYQRDDCCSTKTLMLPMHKFLVVSLLYCIRRTNCKEGIVLFFLSFVFDYLGNELLKSHAPEHFLSNVHYLYMHNA